MREDILEGEPRRPSVSTAGEGKPLQMTSLNVIVISISMTIVGALVFLVSSCMVGTHTQPTPSHVAVGASVADGPSPSPSQAPATVGQPQAPATVGQPQVHTTGELDFSAGMEQGLILQSSPGEAFLVVDLTAMDAPQNTIRPAMGVALVIDRSGSMSGQKMPNAIMAAASFIQSMADGDVVSIFQYDDVVEQLAPPMVVSPASRPALVASVSRMFPRGSTNLYGGLQAGIASLLRPEAERPLRRVVLISDGLANVGPSSPMEIGTIAAQGAMSGISVTTIGVGLDYDEAVLGSVAARSGGRFYHLQQPSQMAMILENELNALSQTVARNVIIDLIPAPGVQFVSATGADIIQQGTQVRLRVGEIQGGARRPVVVTLQLPVTGDSVQDAAQVMLSYASSSGEARQASTMVQYGLTTSQEAVDGSARPQFAVAVEQHRAALATLRAAETLESGDADGAADLLNQHAQAMEQRARSMPAAERASLTNEATRMRRRSKQARRARSRPARRASSLSLHDDALDGLGL